MADSNESLSPVRKWIKKTLITNIPPGTTIWSNTHGKEFELLTGVSHADLLSKWFQIKSDGTPLYDTKGTDPTFTTCTSFLPRFSTKVRLAGKLPIKYRDNRSGKDIDIGLKPFKMNAEVGWIPAFIADCAGGKPREGDFFMMGHNGQADHVGIIVTVKGDQWSVVAGGAGGRGTKHDGVKRSALGPRPGGVLGWLNVDHYFDGWNGPDVGDVPDDY